MKKKETKNKSLRRIDNVLSMFVGCLVGTCVAVAIVYLMAHIFHWAGWVIISSLVSVYLSKALTFAFGVSYEYSQDERKWAAVLRRYFVLTAFEIGYEKWIMDVLPEEIKAHLLKNYPVIFSKFLENRTDKRSR